MTDRDHSGNDPENSTSPHGAARCWPRPRNDDENRALIRRLNELTQLGLVEHDSSKLRETGRVTVRYKLPFMNAVPCLNLLPSSGKNK